MTDAGPINIRRKELVKTGEFPDARVPNVVLCVRARNLTGRCTAPRGRGSLVGPTGIPNEAVRLRKGS